jgi:hypothetical protein
VFDFFFSSFSISNFILFIFLYFIYFVVLFIYIWWFLILLFFLLSYLLFFDWFFFFSLFICIFFISFFLVSPCSFLLILLFLRPLYNLFSFVIFCRFREKLFFKSRFMFFFVTVTDGDLFWLIFRNAWIRRKRTIGSGVGSVCTACLVASRWRLGLPISVGWLHLHFALDVATVF